MHGKRVFISTQEENLIRLIRNIKFGHIQSITVKNGQPIYLDHVIQRVDLNEKKLSCEQDAEADKQTNRNDDI